MNRNEALKLIEDYIDFLAKDGYFDFEDEIELRASLDKFILTPAFKDKYPVRIPYKKKIDKKSSDEASMALHEATKTHQRFSFHG